MYLKPQKVSVLKYVEHRPFVGVTVGCSESGNRRRSWTPMKSMTDKHYGTSSHRSHRIGTVMKSILLKRKTKERMKDTVRQSMRTRQADILCGWTKRKDKEEKLAKHKQKKRKSYSLPNPPGLFVMQDMDLLFHSLQERWITLSLWPSGDMAYNALVCWANRSCGQRGRLLKTTAADPDQTRLAAMPD